MLDHNWESYDYLLLKMSPPLEVTFLGWGSLGWKLPLKTAKASPPPPIQLYLLNGAHPLTFSHIISFIENRRNESRRIKVGQRINSSFTSLSLIRLCDTSPCVPCSGCDTSDTSYEHLKKFIVLCNRSIKPDKKISEFKQLYSLAPRTYTFVYVSDAISDYRVSTRYAWKLVLEYYIQVCNSSIKPPTV